MRLVRHYNLIFPLFITIFLPPFIIIPLLGNLLIDGMVYYLALRQLNSLPSFARLIKLVLPAWVGGFIADILGAAILIAAAEVLPLSLDEVRIWNSLPTVVIMLLTIVLVGVVIYYFNRWLLKSQGYSKQVSHLTALAIGLVTAPWFYLVPAIWLQSFLGGR